MPFIDLTPAPPPPQRDQDEETFAPRADDFVVWMKVHADEMNVFIPQLETAAALIAAAPAYADAGLVSIASLDIAADEMLYGTGANTFGKASLTAFGRSLIDDADASAARSTLGFTATGSAIATAATAAAARSALSVNSTAETAAAISAAVAAVNSVPTGSVHVFAMSAAPSGYLACNGAAVSRTTYAALFAAIGVTHGAGNGSSTFNLPDLRGEFVRGWDDGRGVDTGRAFGSTQTDAFKAHTHSVAVGTEEGDNLSNATNGNGTNSSFQTGSTGSTETRPRNVALLYAIKT